MYSDLWIKYKIQNEDFDHLPMGCYASVEVFELVGSFIFNKLASVASRSNIGLYHDDDLEIFQNISKPEIERKKKQ